MMHGGKGCIVMDISFVTGARRICSPCPVINYFAQYPSVVKASVLGNAGRNTGVMMQQDDIPFLSSLCIAFHRCAVPVCPQKRVIGIS